MSNITEVDFSTPAHDIPRMLRQRAKAIENGEVNPISVVLVEYYGHGDTEVYGYEHQLTPGQAYIMENNICQWTRLFEIQNDRRRMANRR